MSSKIRHCATLLYVPSPWTFKCDYLVIHNTALDRKMTLIKLQREQHHVVAIYTHKKEHADLFFSLLVEAQNYVSWPEGFAEMFYILTALLWSQEC